MIMGTIGFGLFFISTLININAKGVNLGSNSLRDLTEQITFSKNPTGEGHKFTAIQDSHNFTRGDHAYILWKEPKKWNDARNACVYGRGHLLVIHSEKEAAYMREEMERAHVPEVWLGIHDLYSNREFVTILDVPLQMIGWVAWMPNNPDNAGGNQHCVRFMEGRMDDFECDRGQSFICRYEKSVDPK